MSTLFQRNKLLVFERVMKNSVHGTSMLHSNETSVSEYEDHEVYEMVKDVHVILGKQKKDWQK
jgi:hypothetical protein